MANTGDNTAVTSIVKRDPQFESFKSHYFDIVGQSRSSLFNFFLENNDIFQAISKEDELNLDAQYLKYSNRTFNWTFGSLIGVLFFDKVVLRYAAPNFRIKSFRSLVWMGKYIAVPLLSFGVCKYYFCSDIENAFKDAVDKYNFNYDDYSQAMDIMERAHKVGKLDELLNTGKNFDWSTVPEGKPNQQQNE